MFWRGREYVQQNPTLSNVGLPWLEILEHKTWAWKRRGNFLFLPLNRNDWTGKQIGVHRACQPHGQGAGSESVNMTGLDLDRGPPQPMLSAQEQERPACTCVRENGSKTSLSDSIA